MKIPHTKIISSSQSKRCDSELTMVFNMLSKSKICANDISDDRLRSAYYFTCANLLSLIFLFDKIFF
jgi:hypothetical protein